MVVKDIRSVINTEEKTLWNTTIGAGEGREVFQENWDEPRGDARMTSQKTNKNTSRSEWQSCSIYLGIHFLSLEWMLPKQTSHLNSEHRPVHSTSPQGYLTDIPSKEPATGGKKEIG